MAAFLSANLSTIIVGLIVLGLVVLAIRSLIKDHKSGSACGSCGGDCAHCHSQEVNTVDK